MRAMILLVALVAPWLVLLECSEPHIPPCSAVATPNIPCKGEP